MDNTEQQAVPVAQEDIDLVFRLSKLTKADGISAAHQVVARHRLASVSSASAEGFVRVPMLLTAAMADALVAVRDSGASLANVWSALLAASPEPVPATNQAGEVERARGRLANVYRNLNMATTVAEIMRGDWDHTPEIADSLATQPATSQEGEVCALCSGKGFADAQCPVCMLAATPTPPTLNSWANTPEAEHERILLMAEIELHLKSCRIFLTTREKMHPVGVDIHDELLAKVTAAIEATGSEKANG